MRATTAEKHAGDWEAAEPFSEPGWSEEAYLALDTNRLVDYSDGVIEVLSVPTTSHQAILAFLYRHLAAFVAARGLGSVFFAGIRVQLWEGKFREPDLVFMSGAHADRIGELFWKGADLVMEVVSRDKKDRYRDLVTKRREYAKARIPEYWIVDPLTARIRVLRLKGTGYVVAGDYKRGNRATSRIIAGYEVDVTSALAGKHS